MQVWSLLSLLACLTLSAGQQAPPSKRLVCYYENWARYRKPLVRFTPENINPHLCTHLHYAIANTINLRVGPSDKFSDIDIGGYEQILALKKVNPALKVLLMLGGSNPLQINAFKKVISDDMSMRTFAAAVIKYVRDHGFDGIDLDWKVSGQKEGHARLLELLASEFQEESKSSGKENLLISTTIPGNVTKLMEDYDIPRIATSVDYVNALVYQFRPTNGTRTAHHASLFTSDPESLDFIDFIVQMYIMSGADPAKLNLAVPTFGQTYTLSDPQVRGFGAPAIDVGFSGKLTGSPGSLSFTEICEHVSMDGWTSHRPLADSAGPYAVKGNQWVAYDDEFMMRRKGAYIREKGLGGAAVWTISHDDFRGFCTGQQFPLIEALKMGMYEDSQVTTTTPSPPTTPNYDNSAVFTCRSDGRFQKQDNCTEFYQCSEGVAEVKSCEDGTIFDAEQGFCREDAECMMTELPRVTRFEPTLPPFTPMRTFTTAPPTPTERPVTPAPPTSSVRPVTAAPPTPRVRPVTPAPMANTRDAIVVEAEPAPAPRSDMKLDMNMDVNTDGELEQVLQLIRGLGGVDKVRELLSALGKPRGPEAVSQPGVSQPQVVTSTTDGGKTRIRVHVTVEVEPF